MLKNIAFFIAVLLLPFVSSAASTLISGPLNVCAGSTTTLSADVGGGIWATTGGVASIGSTTGILTALAAGTQTISYIEGTDWVSVTVTVNAVPAPVSGSSSVCQYQTVYLSDTVSGGSWISSNVAIGNIDAATGNLTGITPGTINVTYTMPGGCYITRTETILASPGPIFGTTSMCAGSVSTLYNTSVGGIWSIGNPGIATINPASGELSALSAGGTMATYTAAGGCRVSSSVYVYAAPLHLYGCNSVRVGDSFAYYGINPSIFLYSSDYSIVSLTSSQQVVGISPGTANIYLVNMATGCMSSNPVQVTLSSTAKRITHDTSVCVGASVFMSDPTPGGIWSVRDTGMAHISSSGMVTAISAGSTFISYTVGSSWCIMPLRVSNLPTITIPDRICAGSVVYPALTLGPNRFSPTPDYSLMFPYWLSGGIPIDGTPIPGGYLSAPDTTVVKVTNASDPFWGGWPVINASVKGIAAGVRAITYTDLLSGCAVTKQVTVNPLVATISDTTICMGSSFAIAGTAPWSSSDPLIASLDTAGVVTATGAGTTVISYHGSYACSGLSARTIHVGSLPTAGTIIAPDTLCIGTSGSLYDSVTGGTWSVGGSHLSVVSSTALSGLSEGADTIIYTVSNSCGSDTRRHPVQVIGYPSGASIAGSDTLCIGLDYPFTSLPSGAGIWSVGSSSASITATGVFHPITTGLDSVRYTVSNYCGTQVSGKRVLVMAMPDSAAIAGDASVCTGTAISLSSPVASGMWTTADPTLAAVDSAGQVTGLSPGHAVITYSIGNFCGVTAAHHPVSVHSLPGAFPVGGGGTYCAGGTGVGIWMGSTAAHTVYRLYRDGTIVGAATGGSGSIADFGYHTIAGEYYVIATDTVTSCMNIMSDSVRITIMPTVTPLVSLAATPGDTVCAGTLVTYTATPENGGSAPDYQWYVNSVPLMGTGPLFSYYAATGQVVSVHMASTATCALPSTANDSMSLVVQPSIAATVSITAHPGTIIPAGYPDTLIASATSAGTTPEYQWYVNGALIPGATSSVYIADSLHDHDSISCVVQDSDPCALPSFNAIIVHVIPVSVNDIAHDNPVEVYPNPASTYLHIGGAAGAICRLMDIPGRILLQQVLHSDNERMDVSAWPTGNYLLEIIQDNARRVIILQKQR